MIEKTEDFSPNLFGRYFFKINSSEALLSYFENNISVLPENFNAKTIKISLTDFNKYKARDFVNTINNLYVLSSTDTKNQTIKQKIQFLDDQIELTEETIQEFDAYFENFTIENKTVSLQQDLSRAIQFLNTLDSQRFNLQEHFAAVNLIKEKIKKDENLIVNPFIMSRLPQFISAPIHSYQLLLDERLLKLNSYNENTSVIQRIDEQLEATRLNVLELVDQYALNIKDNLRDVNSRRATLESTFIELPSMGTEYNKNRRIYQQHENFLLSLRKSKMDLEITKAGTVADFLILSSASLPANPIRPQKILIMGVGFVAALIFSLIFIATRYLVHNKITGTRELEKLSTVPILGTVPFYKKEKLSLTKLVIDENSKSVISEALRSIRTNMQFIRPSEETGIITITSTIGGEGKTFIAVNLGAIIASSNRKVCVVDLDMRKPKVHLAFGHEESPSGVSTVLIGKTTIEESIKETMVPNMHYLSAGPTPPNPSELMLSDDFDSMLGKLKNEYDLVILDTPPVGLVTDGVLAMKKSDIQLYVVKADFSRRAFIRTIKDLQRTNEFRNLVLLLNGVKQVGGYGYGYGYGYGKGYYEDYGDKGILSMIRSLF